MERHRMSQMAAEKEDMLGRTQTTESVKTFLAEKVRVIVRIALIARIHVMRQLGCQLYVRVIVRIALIARIHVMR